ncbi:MAG TPA: MFS transporter [Terriglobales bacterium]|nr:MFS transporter [Terriglobales bacterium]
MKKILSNRPLQLVFVANLVSMIGSGMNSAATTWFILQVTHSEMALGLLVVLNTLPAIVTMPFTGVIIDREDRRRLVMFLDAARAVITCTVAVLALMHRIAIWELYAAGMAVAAGFWMFWPTVTALIQELTPDSEFVHSNTFLLAGVQGGWMLAGALVGYAYNKIGLGGVMLIDFSTYVVSFACYLFVRKGTHVPRMAAAKAASEARELALELREAEGDIARFWHELREGYEFLRQNRYILPLGISWSLFISGMWTQGILTAPLSDRLLHAGASGYGHLNASWAIGAFLSTAYSAVMIRKLGGRKTVAITMAALGACLFVLPFSHFMVIAAATYCVMGSARGVGGVGITSGMMEMVPTHFMGRVQNTFYFLATLLQIAFGLVVGAVSHNIALAGGFFIVGVLYGLAAVTAVWPVRAAPRLEAAMVRD